MTALARRSLLAGTMGSLLVGTARAQAKTHRIMMISWRGWEDACQGFADYFTERQIPVELIIRDAAQSAATVRQHVAEAKATKPDLVYLWGTTTALTALGPYDAVDPKVHLADEVPAVFNIVTEPVWNKIVPSLEQPGRRATGTLYITGVDQQLATLAAYRPFRSMGVTYSPIEGNSLAVMQLLHQQATKLGFQLIDRPVPLGDDGKPLASALPGKVREIAEAGAQWLYIAPDTFLNGNKIPLTETAMAVGLPSFTSTEPYILQAHALFGLVSRYYAVGQFTGFKAEQILNGADPASIPVEPLARFSLIVNVHTANRLKFYPPLSLLRYAETV
ncbi:MAG TPA: ABC transporter substrate binding protein [Geminicoccus sp.]|jgi:putative ABC transport system substrate-binding protein|uniref:ABC transporter substrate binding protein n=1 Tax=Geminicoccus sp. TaxID=2024832 RepID=UPI002E35E95A|nr:ABC transporter substrate binding protein [Geminicoccus sp.]HEX2525898.1 ABC transporter substrate binding protein [Geminicoccus sp.]